MAQTAIGKYDVSMNCNLVHQIYDSNRLEMLAADEFAQYYNSKNVTDITYKKEKIGTTLSCFCEKYLQQDDSMHNKTFIDSNSH